MTRPQFNDDDLDRFRLRRDPQDEPAAGMSAVKIVAIIASVVLVIALMCGGIAFYAIHVAFKTAEQFGQQIEKIQQEQEKLREEQENSDKEKSRQFANSFVQQLRAKQAEAAYAMTTAAFQKRVSREQFRELVEAQATLLNRFGGFLSDALAPNKGTTFTFSDSLPAKGKFHRLTVTAVKEGETWKVDQFAVEDDDKPGKEP